MKCPEQTNLYRQKVDQRQPEVEGRENEGFVSSIFCLGCRNVLEVVVMVALHCEALPVTYTLKVVQRHGGYWVEE